jgi:hypothetical protein
MGKKTITFIPHISFTPEVVHPPKLPKPTPASLHVPEWYAKSERWTNVDSPVIQNYGANQGLKLCVPFLDGMISGYMVETWTDIQVTPLNETSSRFNWLAKPDPIIERSPSLGERIPVPAGHISNHFAWVGQFGIKVPTGYSVLLTHPLNRHDLPFTTLSGIIDSDGSHAPGNIPFFLKANWEGIIPAGTPIAQILPFKRDNWVSELGDEKIQKEVIQQSFDTRRILNGFYKKNFWHRKSYE